MAIISDYFAEPNLPQKYIETLGAPFGERYVYTIFMQGINVLPDIPSSAEGSELTARVKEVNGNNYSIVEYYYTKQEGEWFNVDVMTISAWTEEEEESSGGGGNVILDLMNGRVFDQDFNTVSYGDIADYQNNRTIVWLNKNGVYYPLYYADTSTFTVVFRNGSNITCSAVSWNDPLLEEVQETE